MAVDTTSILQVVIGLLSWFYYSFLNLIKIYYPDALSKSVKDDIILITGGGSGIGRLMAQKFAKLGATIVTVDVNEANNEKTARLIKEDGGQCYSYTCDLSNREAIYEVASKIKNDVGIVSILINNAGIVSGKSVLDIPDEKIQQTFNVNILAHFWTVKAFLPDMLIKKKGHIVNIASLGGHAGVGLMTDYCSSKFAAVGFDESLRSELALQGHQSYINCTVVCPYYINTGMFDGVVSKIIPIMEPEYVTDKIIQGVLTNLEMVIVPRWTVLLLMIKSIMPVKSFLKMGDGMGTNTAMNTFIGRKKNN